MDEIADNKTVQWICVYCEANCSNRCQINPHTPDTESAQFKRNQHLTLQIYPVALKLDNLTKIASTTQLISSLGRKLRMYNKSERNLSYLVTPTFSSCRSSIKRSFMQSNAMQWRGPRSLSSFGHLQSRSLCVISHIQHNCFVLRFRKQCLKHWSCADKSLPLIWFHELRAKNHMSAPWKIVTFSIVWCLCLWLICSLAYSHYWTMIYD